MKNKEVKYVGIKEEVPEEIKPKISSQRSTLERINKIKKDFIKQYGIEPTTDQIIRIYKSNKLK